MAAKPAAQRHMFMYKKSDKRDVTRPLKMVDTVSTLLNVVLAVVLLCIVAGIGKCISVVASVVRIKHAVRNMPIPRKQHWILGHIPYGVS